jgi:hypothetical protein
MTPMTLIPRDLALMRRLAKAESEVYWACYGPSLDRLIEQGLAAINGQPSMHAHVTLTAKGQMVLKGENNE